MTWKDVLPWITTIITILGFIASYAVTAYRVGEQHKAIDVLEGEIKRLRDRIHRLDNHMQKIVLLLQLIRQGMKIPDEAMIALSTTDKNGNGDAH